MALTQEQIEQKIDDYLHFWGITLTKEQKEKLTEDLTVYRDDEENLEQEMICEIRTLNGE